MAASLLVAFVETCLMIEAVSSLLRSKRSIIWLKLLSDLSDTSLIRLVRDLMWLSDLVEFSSNLLTISEICSRDMVEVVERWKKGRRTEGEERVRGRRRWEVTGRRQETPEWKVVFVNMTSLGFINSKKVVQENISARNAKILKHAKHKKKLCEKTPKCLQKLCLWLSQIKR